MNILCVAMGVALQNFLRAKTLFQQHGIDVDNKFALQLVQEVHDLLENACKKGDEVAILEKIKLLLVQRGLAWHAPCAPGQAGVSEKNRS